MIGIEKSELQIVKQFNYGSFSHVFEAYYNGMLFCYKQFRRDYPEDILKNICEMTEECYSCEFAPPLLMVFENAKIVGYLCDLKKNTIEIDEIFDIKKKKLLLQKAKIVLTKFHREYKRIHGDINHANFIFDEELMQPYLIDFDSSLKFGQEVGSKVSFPGYLIDYLQYYPFDYLADVYEFNLLTLIILARKNHKVLLEEIKDGIYPVGESLKDVRRLCRELVLDDSRKQISGEFIIDYL